MEITQENALAIVSTARKLIFKVPQGELTSFPEGVTISEYGQNNQAPSIVVHNYIDTLADPKGSWQGADSNEGIVIMNAVPGDIADELIDLYETDPTVEGLLAVIAHAEELGCTDNYTTKTGFVESKLTPAGRMLDKYTGIVKRDDRDICYIVRDANGTIWRKLGSDVRHIDTDEILVRDYVLPNGDKIDPTLIPTV